MPRAANFGTLCRSFSREESARCLLGGQKSMDLKRRNVMQKKLLGMAVAAALAVPTAVLAQSAVTISGTFKVGVDHQSVGDKNPARTGKKSEFRVVDNSSQIHFNVTEDLGGGMAAIA